MNLFKNRFVAAIWVCVLSALLFSCHHPMNSNILSEKKFIALMVDIHLADAIASEKGYIDQTYQIDSASLYGSVFKKHGVSKAEFDSTMAWYSTHPEDLQKVYNRITAELKERQQKINSGNKPHKENEILWQNDQAFRYPPMTNNKIDIDVAIPGPGTYTITALVQIFSDDETANPRMSVYFYRREPGNQGKRIYFDEVKYIEKSGLPKIYSVTKKLTDPEITNIRGRIFEYYETGRNMKHHVEIKNIRIIKEN
jgi:hypothetical protein